MTLSRALSSFPGKTRLSRPVRNVRASAARSSTAPRTTGLSSLARFLAALVAAWTVCAYGADAKPKCGSVKGNPELAIKVCTQLIEFAGLPRPDLAAAYFTRAAEWRARASAIAHPRSRRGDRPRSGSPGAVSEPCTVALRTRRTRARDPRLRRGDQARARRRADVYRPRGEWTVLGDYKRASSDYEEVIRRQPKNMSGHFGRGRVRFYAGDFIPAASDLLRAHQLDASIYTALWLFLARKRANIAGEKTLAQDAGTSGGSEGRSPSLPSISARSRPKPSRRRRRTRIPRASAIGAAKRISTSRSGTSCVANARLRPGFSTMRGQVARPRSSSMKVPWRNCAV